MATTSTDTYLGTSDCQLLYRFLDRAVNQNLALFLRKVVVDGIDDDTQTTMVH